MMKWKVIYLSTYILLTATIPESIVSLLCIIYDELTLLLMYPVHIYSPASDNFRILKLKKTFVLLMTSGILLTLNRTVSSK